MRMLGKSFSLGLAGLIVMFSLNSCGGGGASNDQGVSFTALGFFAALPDVQCDPFEPFISRVVTTISESQSEDDQGSGGTVSAVMAMQNNLTSQFIRTQRAYLDFFIPGAEVQPPSTVSNAATLIQPLAPDEGEDFDSSLPPGFAEEDCNRGYTTIAVVPGEIREWINLNRGSLPEAPFTMVVEARVRGVTSAGDDIESNAIELFVEFIPDNVIAPDEGVVDGEAA